MGKITYRLTGGDRTVQDELSLLSSNLGNYDVIVEDPESYALDEILHERSAYECVRDQLTDAQQAELDQVDQYWLAHPDAFNTAFKRLHAFEDRRTALKSWVIDSNGDAPVIPKTHWWWRPIKSES